MAEEGRNNTGGGRLPIKLIMPKQGVERKVPPGGSPPHPFRTVDEAYRARLSKQVSAISKTFDAHLDRLGAIPVRVKLIPEASAKSHRPEKLFSSQSCPIVGAGRLGELFVKATAEGLTRLKETVENNESESVIKEISCVEAIEPITGTYRRKGISGRDILRRSPRGGAGFIARIRLFDFGAEPEQPVLIRDFEDGCKQQGININQEGYSEKSLMYAVECRSVEDINVLSNLVGVRSIASMPRVKTIRPKISKIDESPSLPKRGDVKGDIPVVVVVDSGVSQGIREFDDWVVDRESYVAPDYENCEHGTFVAGLVCWGSDLNPHLSGLDENPCGVFDLQVIPNDDPKKGDTTELLETEFLYSLESALRQHANEYKVWNLSLGTDDVCSLDEFSALAEELDNLQEKYRVSFVISSGNYNIPPLLDYPREQDQLDKGRITAPADSVLGMAVGAISHASYTKKKGPKENEPSAFSRHGAGPNHVIKPDLVHFGGTCSKDLSHIDGIRSISEEGVCEDIGTSFAAPLVSRTLAQIYHQITPTPTPELARALLTHHARDPRTGGRVADREENFLGFGLPAVVPYCLDCTPYSSTLVFDDVLRPGYFLEWNDFPYPPSLQRDGRYFGEVWMTVAFKPTRGSRWGTEYCETHIDAHFGVYHERVNRKTGEVSINFKGLVPPEHKNRGELYESYQIEKLRKWSPVRTYHGLLPENGVAGLRWRLKVKLLTRHGIEDSETFSPQPFSLILTIADPNEEAPIYDEMSQIIRNRFQAQNIAVRPVARVQAGV